MPDENGYILVRNVRCSFPKLFGPEVRDGKTYSAGVTLLFDPTEHADAIAEIERAMQAAADKKLGGRLPPAHARCLKRGELVTRPEYQGYVVMSANNPTRPTVVDHVDPRRVITDPADCPIYAGCRVHVKFDIWGQDSHGRKGINAKLIAIQYAGDDEPLDGNYVPPEVATAGFDAAPQSDTDPMGSDW